MSSHTKLLIPIHLDCLVVSNDMVDGVSWHRPTADYSRLQNLESPEPQRNDRGKKPQVGVSLHWALPDALTRAREVQRGKGKLEFPHVPNRWLVLRLGPERPKWKGWVLQSDHLGDGASPFVDPSGGIDGTAPTPKTLGKKYQLHPKQEWPGEAKLKAQALRRGEDPEREAFLRAVGPGDLTFAAWQPGVDGVFSMHDDLADLDREQKYIDLSYTLVGWYSEPRLDPLATGNNSFKQRMKDYKWALEEGTQVSTPPRAILCHASKFGVRWQKNGAPSQPNRHQQDWVDNLHVAVGNTAADGLAAILEARVEEDKATSTAASVAAEIFEALQYDALETLDEAGGKVRLDHQIRDHWFAGQPGGTRWEVVAADSASAADANAAPSLSIHQEKWLVDLNLRQRKLDSSQHKLESLQAKLYDLWWTEQKTAGWDQDLWDMDEPPDVTELRTTALNTVQKQQGIVTQLQQDLPADPTDLPGVTAWLREHADQHQLPPSLELKASALPRFWHPTDPVVVVSGLQRAQKHGEDGRYRDDDRLLCRLTTQAVSGLSGARPGKAVKQLIPNPTAKDIPDVSAILTEAFFLDPANHADIGLSQEAITALWSSPMTIKTGSQTTSPQTTSQATTQSGDNAVLPSPLGVQSWQQAWAPLFLDWGVSYYPSTFESEPFGFDRDQWRLSAQKEGVPATAGAEYQAKENASGKSLTGAVELGGRTFLTPQVEYRFSKQVSRYIQAHPPTGFDQQAQNKFIEKFNDLDVLSQSLSGFNQQLIMRSTQSNLPPGEALKKVVGEQYHSLPNSHHGEYPPYFFPVRGGYFHFTSLRMVDAFGQQVNLLFGNGNNIALNPATKDWPSFKPYRGRGLLPAADAPVIKEGATAVDMMLLPPRIVQATRLNFRLLDGRAAPVKGNTHKDELGLVAGAKPVCGWLIANHLDKGLSIYNEAGFLLGELILRTQTIEAEPVARVDWLPAPAAKHNLVELNSNPYLEDLVSSLLEHPDAGTAFENLLEVIDSTLWMLDPLSGRTDQNLSVLIGRPLALVRARLSLTLRGDPVFDQSWDFLGRKTETTGFEALKFDVKLGDPELRNDGLMGYFLDKEQRPDFMHLHAVHPLEKGAAEPAYVIPIQDGNYIPLSCHKDDCQVVTLLLDPRGAVHASSGLLPSKTLELPGNYVEDLLSAMRLCFRAGPLLTEPDVVRFPRPAERHGSWDWLAQDKPGHWVEQQITDLGHEARLFDELPVLQEGWLQLSEALPKLSYAIETDPKPLIVSNKQQLALASLKIRISNLAKQALLCDKVVFIIPMGKAAGALVEAVEGIGVSSLSDWHVERNKDRVIATAPKTPQGKPIEIPPGASKEIMLHGLLINHAPGTARIFVMEGSRGNPSSSLAISKERA